MSYPTKCAVCGGAVVLYKMHVSVFPYTLSIPTCNKCKESFINEQLAIKMDDVQARLFKKARGYKILYVIHLILGIFCIINLFLCSQETSQYIVSGILTAICIGIVGWLWKKNYFSK